MHVKSEVAIIINIHTSSAHVRVWYF